MLKFGLSALNAGTVFSSSEMSLSVELKPSFLGDSSEPLEIALMGAKNRFCAFSVLLQVEIRQVKQRCYSHIWENNLV